MQAGRMALVEIPFGPVGANSRFFGDERAVLAHAGWMEI